MRSSAVTTFRLKKTEVREGRFTPANLRHRNCTLIELLDDYMKSFEARQIRDTKTVGARIKVWRELGGKPARKITIGDIETCLLRYCQWKALGAKL